VAEWAGGLEHEFRRRIADHADLVVKLDGDLVPAPVFKEANQAGEVGWEFGRSAARAGLGRRRCCRCRTAVAAQPGDKRCWIGHVGSMDEPQQCHFCGLARVWRNADILQALEEHLPQAVNAAPRQLMGKGRGRVPFFRRL